MVRATNSTHHAQMMPKLRQTWLWLNDMSFIRRLSPVLDQISYQTGPVIPMVKVVNHVLVLAGPTQGIIDE
jgi:hypothetical protein